MWQIFNRISRLINSEFRNKDNHNYKTNNTTDDELKKIIDELNNDNNKNSSNHKTSNSDSSDAFEFNYKEIEEAYLFLNLKNTSTIYEIRDKYRELIKKNHPDKFTNHSIDAQKKAIEITQKINKAYNLLRKYRNF